MIGCHLHASGSGNLQGFIVLCQLLDSLCKITLGCSLLLFSRGLQGLLFVHVFGVCLDLIGERLFQHVAVVLSGGLGFPQIRQLAFSFLFHVLKDIEDAGAVCFIDRGCRCSWFLVILRFGILLHECGELLVIVGRESGSVDHGFQTLENAVQALGIYLHQSCWVLGHFPLQDCSSPVESVDGIHELMLCGLEGGALLVTHFCSLLQFLLIFGDGLRKLLDLCIAGRDVCLALCNCCVQLFLLGFTGLDLVPQVGCSIITPLDIIVECLSFFFALFGDLGSKRIHQLIYLAEWISVSLDRSWRSCHQKQKGDLADLHCCGLKYKERVIERCFK